MATKTPRLFTVLFFLVAALLLVLWSWEGSPLNHDEITYLAMARTMVTTGNWLDLQFYGATVHQRPPLAIWLLAFSGQNFGFSLVATRLPSIVMAFLSLCFVSLAVAELRPANRRLALLGAALLLATPLFYFNARRPMTDTTFLAGATAFVWAYLSARTTPQRWLIAGVATGWMLMSKGVVTALPLAAVGAHLILTPRRKELRTHLPWMGAGIALLIAAPWHIAQTVRHGTGFWEEYIGFNVLQRAGQALFQETPATFYLENLWLDNPPLAILFAAGMAHTAYRLWQHRPGSVKRDEEKWQNHLFVALWFLAAAVPMSMASTRIEHYFLPSLPALAAATALSIPYQVARRVPMTVALFFLTLTLFFFGNSIHLYHPDYSPDQQRFARQIAAKPAARVVAINHYELALFYFLEQPIDMLTTSARFFEIVDSAPILHRIGAVTLQPPNQLLETLRRAPFFALTTPANLPLLCGSDNSRCQETGPFVVTPGDYLVLVNSR